MADVALGAKARRQVEQVGFDLRPEVADDKGNVVKRTWRHGRQILHEVLDDGLAGHMNQGLGHGQRVGTQAAAASSHGDDEVHVVPV